MASGKAQPRRVWEISFIFQGKEQLQGQIAWTMLRFKIVPACLAVASREGRGGFQNHNSIGKMRVGTICFQSPPCLLTVHSCLRKSPAKSSRNGQFLASNPAELLYLPCPRSCIS